MPKYDSTAERQFHGRNPSLVQFNNNLPDPNNSSKDLKITDIDGSSKSCKVDFKYGSVLIEFKSFQLNNIESRAVAAKRIFNQVNRGCSRHYAELKYGFNHSLYKQLAMNKAYPNRFLLVFQDATELSQQSINRMNASNLCWCFESDMWDRLESMQQSLDTQAA